MMIVVMVVMMAVVVGVRVIVRVIVRVRRLVLARDADVRRGEAGSEDTRDVQLVAHAQAAERRAQLVERQARVEQRAEHHVAGGA
jgi:hypothetical protein